MTEIPEPSSFTPASEPFEHIVATGFDDGDGVLVDLNTKQYYQLNETAMLIWRGLETGKSVEDIVSELMAVYDVNGDHARASVNKLLQNLAIRKLIKARE